MKNELEKILSEMSARADAATPGPWTGIIEADEYSLHYIVNYNPMTAEEADRDVEFIVHARQDVPILLAMIRKLIEQRDQRVPNNLMTFPGLSERDDAELVKIARQEASE